MLSTKLNTAEKDIRELFYVELCMAHCWCLEDGELNETYREEILVAENERCYL